MWGSTDQGGASGAVPLASALRELALRCGEEGWLTQAETLLDAARTVAAAEAGITGDAVVWDLARLLLRRGAIVEANEWFRRTAPAISDPAIGDLVVGVAFASAPQAPTSVPRAGAGLLELNLRSLGQFRIARGGSRLDRCRSRRAIWVLRYILSRPERAAHKGELAALLWPDALSHRAHHSLHVAVSALRAHLDPPDAPESYVLCADDRYALNPTAVVCDDCATLHLFATMGDRFRQTGDLDRAERSYAAALDLYSGDYDLTGLAFDWAVAEQRRHLATYLTVLEHLGTIASAQRNFERAIDCFSRLLARDPYREDVSAQLMIAYGCLGRRSDAIHEYARCARELTSDLGIAPSAELQTLYQRMLRVETPSSP